MLLAEAVTFDPGIVVLAFVVFLVVCSAVAALVVGGLVAGVRAARDPSRRTAAATWAVCAGVQATVLVLAVITGWPEGAAVILVALALAVCARFGPQPRA
jgi:hypothetical protein